MAALLGMVLGGTVAVVVLAALIRITIFKLLKLNQKAALVLSYLLAGAVGVLIYNFADTTNPNALADSLVSYIGPAIVLAALTAVVKARKNEDPAQEFANE